MTQIENLREQVKTHERSCAAEIGGIMMAFVGIDLHSSLQTLTCMCVLFITTERS